MYANKHEIDGTDYRLAVGENLKVTNEGKMVARNVDIGGSVRANAGSIGSTVITSQGIIQKHDTVVIGNFGGMPGFGYGALTESRPAKEKINQSYSLDFGTGYVGEGILKTWGGINPFPSISFPENSSSLTERLLFEIKPDGTYWRIFKNKFNNQDIPELKKLDVTDFASTSSGISTSDLINLLGIEEVINGVAL